MFGLSLNSGVVLKYAITNVSKAEVKRRPTASQEQAIKHNKGENVSGPVEGVRSRTGENQKEGEKKKGQK